MLFPGDECINWGKPSPPAPTLAAVLDRIRAYAVAQSWSLGPLALRAGLSRGALRNLHRPTWSPTTATVKAIEALIPADWRAGDTVAVEGANATVSAGEGT